MKTSSPISISDLRLTITLQSPVSLISIHGYKCVENNVWFQLTSNCKQPNRLSLRSVLLRTIQIIAGFRFLARPKKKKKEEAGRRIDGAKAKLSVFRRDSVPLQKYARYESEFCIIVVLNSISLPAGPDRALMIGRSRIDKHVFEWIRRLSWAPLITSPEQIRGRIIHPYFWAASVCSPIGRSVSLQTKIGSAVLNSSFLNLKICISTSREALILM